MQRKITGEEGFEAREQLNSSVNLLFGDNCTSENATASPLERLVVCIQKHTTVPILPLQVRRITTVTLRPNSHGIALLHSLCFRVFDKASKILLLD